MQATCKYGDAQAPTGVDDEKSEKAEERSKPVSNLEERNMSPVDPRDMEMPGTSEYAACGQGKHRREK